MSDLISRREAEDIVRFECGEWTGLAETIVKRFEALPSEQPEQFNPCTVCQEFDCTGCKFRRTEGR